MVKPETGQAKRAEKTVRSPLSAFSATARPSARLSAVSIEIGETVAEVRFHDEAVHHDVDVVLELLVERWRLGDLVELAVDLDPLEPFLLQLLQFLAVLAFAATHDGRHQVEARAVGHRLHAIDHLRHGLAFDRQAGRR